MSHANSYRGRLAPTPSGRLHLGVARTCLVAWLAARKAGGALVYRLEDLDTPRVVAGSAVGIAADLKLLGLDWDEGGGQPGMHGPYEQGQRGEFYQRALEHLAEAGLIFECGCSRRDVRLAQLALAEQAEASRAPHGDLGPTYPGTCRATPRLVEVGSEVAGALRFEMPDRLEPFEDRVQGHSNLDVRDDFVVRRADGLFAYQLAVVVDDAAMGITEVVRGADLLSSTHRQLALYRALGLAAPRFVHVPLMLETGGSRMAKRMGSASISGFLERGATAPQLVGALGASLGLCPVGSECCPEDLLANFEVSGLPSGPTVFSAQDYGLPAAST